MITIENTFNNKLLSRRMYLAFNLSDMEKNWCSFNKEFDFVIQLERNVLFNFPHRDCIPCPDICMLNKRLTTQHWKKNNQFN